MLSQEVKKITKLLCRPQIALAKRLLNQAKNVPENPEQAHVVQLEIQLPTEKVRIQGRYAGSVMLLTTQCNSGNAKAA